MMKPTINYLNNILFCLIPETKGFRIKAFMLRLAGARIGNNVRICSSFKIYGAGELEIGDDVWIGHQVIFTTTSKISIGSHVDLAPRVYIGTGSHQIDRNGLHSAGKFINEDVIIEDGVWVCANSTILPGSHVSKKSIIAAGAIVKGTVDSFSLYGGIPAKLIKKI